MRRGDPIVSGQARHIAIRSRHSVGYRCPKVGPDLQSIGFLGFYNRQQARADREDRRQLFPEPAANDRDWIGARSSRFWHDYLAKIGLKDGRDGIGAHSFRHTMADYLRAAGYLDAAFGPLILGHNVKSVTGGYGRMPQGTAKTLRETIDAVAFKGVDFDRLRVGADKTTRSHL